MDGLLAIHNFMPSFDGYFCATCKQFHSGLPLSYAADSPDSYAWLNDKERDDRAVISSDQCIIDDEKYSLRGLIEIPIIGFDEFFLWSVWASVLKEAFEEIDEHWQTPAREKLIGPYKGRINNGLTEYSPTTFNLKCTIRIQTLGSRPLFFIDEPAHPLAIEQRNGISLERVQQIASALMHKND
ncbi:MAG TPA: DUF2199 domain-containing protein [Verrucomicrobiae bacterium]|nr:DUF2199 domain-containing protein [Verrucomicrobiae bacterium]